jgi:anti-sigma factor RsiW
MKKHMSNEHLSAERLQAFLESDLPARDVDSIEEHLTVCARCSGELDAWRLLFDDLGGLGAYRPIEGFSDRVMSGMSMAAAPAPEASAHMRVEVIQDFLEASLVAREADEVERHLRGCVPCTAEADAWIDIFGRLSALESFTPSERFADEVMAAVEIRQPFRARVRGRVAALVRTPTPEHVPDGILQDFVDGILPARSVTAVEKHLAVCRTCTHDLQGWQAIAARLDALGSHSPSRGFSEQVMASFRMQQLVQAAAPVPFRSRSAARLRRLIPDARQALAALSGIAVTPVAIAGVLAYTVFSHPTLTFGSLVSFAWWQMTDVAAAVFSGVSAVLFPSGAGTIAEVLAGAPMVVGASILLYTMMSALALRVLYKNLFANRPADGRYAYVTLAS